MHSTVSLSHDCTEALSKLARRSHCSKSDLIARLLRNEIARNNKSFVRGVAVQYQPPCEDGLVIVHVFLDSDLYEACLDLRKFTKKSVSLILSEAIWREFFGSGFVSDNYILFYSLTSIIETEQSFFIICHQVKVVKQAPS